MINKDYLLNDLEDTNYLASIISSIAQPNLILLLNGTLGSGKTQLTKMIGKKLGINEVINSPTFIIWNEYQTKYDWKLIHMDAYRLSNISQVEEYYEIMNDNFMIIEWPDKLPIKWEEHMYVKINISLINNKRKINISTNLLKTSDETQIKNKLKKLNTIKG